MEGSPAPPPCFCITGHGRSGTSFLTAMLQSAGLDIGHRLMGPGEADPRGHFEDMEFHEFHVAVLGSQGYGVEGFILEPSVRVQEQFVAPARAIVEARRRAGKPWGWDEPRSTLFLDFWHTMVPELKFLLLFRRPWDVIDSLFRRGDALYHQNPNLAVHVWLNYNRTALDFADRHPEHCLLIESYAAALDPRRLTEAIANTLGVELGPIAEGIYEDDLFRHEETSQRRSILAHFFPEAIAVYEQLRSRAALALEAEAEEPSSGDNPADLDWALQYWSDFRRLEAQEHRASRPLQIQLDASQQQLRQAQADLERREAEVAAAEHVRAVLGRVENERDDFRIRLEHAEAELERTWVEAEHIRTTLARAEADRDDSRARLVRAEAEMDRLNQALQHAQAQLASVQSSKFWKLRRLWLRVRSSLRRPPPPTDGPGLIPNGAVDRSLAEPRGNRSRLKLGDRSPGPGATLRREPGRSPRR